ncbi:MAG: tRNA preQ1(34) S-adenosylmethionine ribosyltransferase-isomerase QueA [Woeseiaceae bacterium]
MPIVLGRGAGEYDEPELRCFHPTIATGAALLPSAPMNPADFDYELPPGLIAKYPPARRRDSRLLVIDRRTGQCADRCFEQLPEFLRAGDLLVFNDTRVVKARLSGRKSSGGKVEILIERKLSETMALAQVRASKPPAAGTLIALADSSTATVIGRRQEFYELGFSEELEPLLERIGTVPLPPYIDRDAEAVDRERYQTVYAVKAGAVAAPTAGLHFDREMMEETLRAGIRHAFVTLHVGAGTFQPLRPDRLAAGRLHAERVEVDEATCEAVLQTREAGGRVIAVGTTSVRALESASAIGRLQPFRGETELFIAPGYRFKSIDLLLTNFHLPRSSLLMLVAAFGGQGRILGAYRHAVENRYRFFSYGDAMLILPGAVGAERNGR